VEDVSCSSETAEYRCCNVLVRNVVCDCNVKAVEVPDRRNSKANLDKFVILDCLSGVCTRDGGQVRETFVFFYMGLG